MSIELTTVSSSIRTKTQKMVNRSTCQKVGAPQGFDIEPARISNQDACGTIIRSRFAGTVIRQVRGAPFSQVSRCVMSIIGWIILGLIAGFIASKIVDKTGQGFFMDLVLGIVGAIVGGFIFSALGIGGITGFNLCSMVVAVIGAIIVLAIYHWVSGRRAL